MGGDKMNPHQVTRDFEKGLCDYTGAPYCVTVESCSAALFLSFLYCDVKNAEPVTVPSFTYPSVPSSIINAGGRVGFEDYKWQDVGWYGMTIKPKDASRNPAIIMDSAKYFARGMWGKMGMRYGTICLSFHIRKYLPIGRGGAILTDDKDAYEWFKCMRFDGRHEAPLPTDTLVGCGYNMYLSPELAARGLELLSHAMDGYVLPPDAYQDLSKYDFYTKANR